MMVNMEKAELFNLTLEELSYTRQMLVEKTLDFLGQIGGLAHLIVPSNMQALAGLGGGRLITSSEHFFTET